MFNPKSLALAGATMAIVSTSASAFFDELVIGMTSVTNNLIDSTESVTNNAISTTSTTMLSLSSNPGKMADRIGVMADRIGFMADRIVTTEGIMAGLAHKIIDSNQRPRVVHQYASAYAPTPAPMQAAYQPTYQSGMTSVQRGVGNPYLAMPATAITANPVMPADNRAYSASHIIYGVSGATYTAASPATVIPRRAATYPSAYGFSARPAVNTAADSCGLSYGVARRC